MRKTYRSIYKYPALRLETTALLEHMKKVPIELTYPILDKSSLFGIEVEVENLEMAPMVGPFWATTEDGSLRNYGKEFISRPIRGPQVEYALRYLFNKLKETPYEFTQRCSIHIHCNARTMEPKQLYNMMMLYIIFERLLFKFVGEDRDKNIHCVPLYETALSYILPSIINAEENPRSWMKYTALNLVPLHNYGTIEFRHLHGTKDLHKIMTWIHFILKMKLYAYKNPVEEVQQEIFNLNSNSAYRTFVTKVFGTNAEDLIGGLEYKEYADYMEDGVMKAKSIFNADTFSNLLLNCENKRLKKFYAVTESQFTSKDKEFFLQQYLNSEQDVPPTLHVNFNPSNQWVVSASDVPFPFQNQTGVSI